MISLIWRYYAEPVTVLPGKWLAPLERLVAFPTGVTGKDCALEKHTFPKPTWMLTCRPRAYTDWKHFRTVLLTPLKQGGVLIKLSQLFLMYSNLVSLTDNKMGYLSFLFLLSQSSFICIWMELTLEEISNQKYFYIKDPLKLSRVVFKNGQILHRSVSFMCISYNCWGFMLM